MSQSFAFFSLQDLIQACHEELKVERENEVGYCFELFRRAFDEKDEAAWEAIQHLYIHLVRAWVRGASCHPIMERDMEDLSQEAFTKFWCALHKRTAPLHEQFEHVGGLLKYLRQCVVTAVLDFYRQQQRETHLHQQLMVDGQRPFETLPGECLDHVIEVEQLKRVQQWVQTHITDFYEEVVIRLSFEQNFSPLQIVNCYPQHFANARDVYRVKERVLKRARRALSLK